MEEVETSVRIFIFVFLGSTISTMVVRFVPDARSTLYTFPLQASQYSPPDAMNFIINAEGVIRSIVTVIVSHARRYGVMSCRGKGGGSDFTIKRRRQTMPRSSQMNHITTL